MIWSCEINYHGWEDDIQHHHFFIESDTKPTEEEVAEHYNFHHFVARGNREDDEWIGHNWIRKALPEEKEYRSDTGWVALYNNGSGEVDYYNVYISIRPLKVEKLDGSD